MAKWFLKCVKCGQEFQYSQIDDVGMADFYLPSKPNIPENACVCPNCGHSALYKRTDLFYRP
jgi:DNA-directed RNA polymerase subunit RPC12/RpoP